MSVRDSLLHAPGLHRARACVCVCACVRACVCACMRACACVCMRASARVRVCVRVVCSAHFQRVRAVHTMLKNGWATFDAPVVTHRVCVRACVRACACTRGHACLQRCAGVPAFAPARAGAACVSPYACCSHTHCAALCFRRVQREHPCGRDNHAPRRKLRRRAELRRSRHSGGRDARGCG